MAGVSYDIGTSEATYQLPSQGSFQEGDLVTLLLGMNGEIISVPVSYTHLDVYKRQTYTTAAVERRDITSEITGSGSLEAANSYSVTSLVDGTILADYFEEGDQVNEDTVLYDIDSSDMASSLEQSEISLSQAQRS